MYPELCSRPFLKLNSECDQTNQILIHCFEEDVVMDFMWTLICYVFFFGDVFSPHEFEWPASLGIIVEI